MKDDILKFRKIYTILTKEKGKQKKYVYHEMSISEPSLVKILTADLNDLKGLRASTLGVIQDFNKRHMDDFNYSGIKSITEPVSKETSTARLEFMENNKKKDPEPIILPLKIMEIDETITGQRVHWVRILVSDTLGSAEITRLYWEVPWTLRLKYNWYFKYRAALLQVQNPKKYVEMTWGNFSKLSPKEKKLHDLKNKIIAKKRKITEFTNKFNYVKQQWNELFPIEDDPQYNNVIAKLERLKCELISFEKEFEKTESDETT
ncbi:MAG: hypothetical protein UR43_C0028G0006 [candidate division TM6 bacterium GW2011_GWF2_33_332]|nr:MAG: hypothetical protein UR43_C0028G0006 [candidate division TM6 bacterium GW2011_GWF2_33_332]